LIVFLLFAGSAIGQQIQEETGYLDLLKTLAIPIFVTVILALGFVQKVQIILDRASDTLKIQRRTLLGYRVETHKLSDFRCAEMQDNGGDVGETGTRPVLHFAHSNGTSSVPLFTGFTSWGSSAFDAIQTMNTWNNAHAVDSGSQST